eukprot:7461949-Pyramimonas_sp.AAC.2
MAHLAVATLLSTPTSSLAITPLASHASLATLHLVPRKHPPRPSSRVGCTSASRSTLTALGMEEEEEEEEADADRSS